MRRSPLLVVYLTVFIDLLGFGIILPVLPFYAQTLGANGMWVGVILAAYSAAQFLGAPLLGRLSDRVGRRPVLLASLAGSAASFTVIGLSQSLGLLILGRALAGLFGGSIATAQAYIADVTKPEERTRYMGFLGASIGMGFIFGPAIGALLYHYSPELGHVLARFHPGLGLGFTFLRIGSAAFASAGLACLNLIFAAFALKESRPPDRKASPRTRMTLSNFWDALTHPYIGRILASTTLATLGFVCMEATFALFGKQQFGLKPSGLGMIFMFVGIVIAIVQGGLVGRLNARFGERNLAVVGALIAALALGFIPLITSLHIAIAVMGALAVGQGLLSPALYSLISQETDPDEQGGTLGLNQSLAAGARAVGPVAAGWLFDVRSAYPYFAGALLTLLVALLVSGVRTFREMPS